MVFMDERVNGPQMQRNAHFFATSTLPQVTEFSSARAKRRLFRRCWPVISAASGTQPKNSLRMSYRRRRSDKTIVASLVGGSAYICQAVAIGQPESFLSANRYGIAAFLENANFGEVLRAADLTSCR